MERTNISNDMELLESRLGYAFKNRDLFDLALTHSSWANERDCSGNNNERLEFLGDAVLEMCISSQLYELYPDAREGDLTRLRSRLVNEESLARQARSLGLDKIIKLGIGEEKQGGRDRNAILADAFESVLAAIYQDGGFEAAFEFVKRVFINLWPENWHEIQTLDNKSRLQTVSQRLFRAFPKYELERTEGPEHAKIFSVRVLLPDGQIFYAANSSCKKAEQDAAGQALTALEGNMD